MLFIKDGKFVMLNQEDNITEKNTEKGWLIINNYNYLINNNDLNRLANMWINIKFHKCQYNSEITNKVNKLKTLEN